MKKLMSLIAMAALAVSVTGCARTQATCDAAELDGTQVCFDEREGAYAIEEGATLRVSVDNDDFGNAIVALWDATYPELAGQVEFVNLGAAGSADEVAVQQGEYADVFLGIDGEMPRNASHLLALESHLANLIKENSIDSYFQAGNGAKTVYAPMTYDGMSFVWNKTMLEEILGETLEVNELGLPEKFDTWEEIFALSTEWAANRPTYKGNQVNIVFPLSLGEPWSGYSSTTSAGWRLYASGDALKPGYEDPKFAEGLQFILAARDAKISVEETGELTPGDAMGWRWDDVINNESAPFGLVGTWMDINAAVENTGAEFVMSPMPTYNGERLAPFVKTKGFAINAYTEYRSAAHELLRLIYSAEGFQAMVDNSSYAPSLVDGSALTPTLDASSAQAQMMKAFTFNYPEPAMMLPNNPQMKAMDAAYYGINIADFYAQIWNGDKTIDEAVAEIIELSEAKIAELNQ